MNSNDLLVFNTAAAVSNVYGSGNRPRGGGEDPAAYYPRIFDVKGQYIIRVAHKAEIIEGFAERLLNRSEARSKGGKGIAVGYNSVYSLSLGLVRLGLGLAGVELATGGFYSEDVIDITAAPVSGIFGAERFLDSAVLDEVVAICLRQYSADIGIQGLFFIRVGVTYRAVL